MSLCRANLNGYIGSSVRYRGGLVPEREFFSGKTAADVTGLALHLAPDDV